MNKTKNQLWDADAKLFASMKTESLTTNEANLEIFLSKREVQINIEKQDFSIGPASFVFSHYSPKMKSASAAACSCRYLFPFALLCVLHSIWQLSMLVAPPLLHAVTWSASMSFRSHILVWFWS